MPLTSSEDECHCDKSDEGEIFKMRNFLMRSKMRNRRKRRRSSCDRAKEELYTFFRKIRAKKYRANEGHLLPMSSIYEPSKRKSYYKSASNRIFLSGGSQAAQRSDETPSNIKDSKCDLTCWIEKLPNEILLLIFRYLPLEMLLLVIPRVCKKWKKLAMDWTLWKAVEHLIIESMVATTSEVKFLLRTIPKLKKLELIFRNDTEELLEELFRASDHLEVLRLDHCIRSGLHLNIPSNVIKSMLKSCPKLKSVTLTDTYFRSRNFYKSLAQRFRTFEHISITCTTKSEMDFFMDNLKTQVPEVEFQNVSMMGKADGAVEKLIPIHLSWTGVIRNECGRGFVRVYAVYSYEKSDYFAVPQLLLLFTPYVRQFGRESDLSEAYHWAEMHTKLRKIRHKQVSYAPLTEEEEVELGANLLGEVVLFTLMSIILYFELARQGDKKAVKERMKEEEIQNVVETISDIMDDVTELKESVKKIQKKLDSSVDELLDFEEIKYEMQNEESHPLRMRDYLQIALHRKRESDYDDVENFDPFSP